MVCRACERHVVCLMTTSDAKADILATSTCPVPFPERSLAEWLS